MTCISMLGLILMMFLGCSDGGVSFVRWGRTTCPSGSITLYKGYMAGSYYAQGGSGANFLCMNEQPQFVRGVPGRQGHSGMILGVEFEYFASLYKNLFSNENIPGGVLLQQDMPCVRCYVSESSDQMVMPGRQDCGNTDYHLQYKGFLVSEGHFARGRSEFVCLDEAPEGVSGGTADDNHALVYPVEIGCGSLPCNPYVDGLEATCAVCTL